MWSEKKWMALLPLLIAVAWLSLAGCKGDDESSEGSSPAPSTEEGGELLAEYSQEDGMLRALLSHWTAATDDELYGEGWRSANYPMTVGEVSDESRPLVRSLVVGTLAKADSYARQWFSTLGIDYLHPDGFRFSDPQVGTVSYRHGGSNANILATIDISLAQMTNCQQLLLLKAHADNEEEKEPYYHFGDIIRNTSTDTYLICVSRHGYGEGATFVSVNVNEQQKVTKFPWARLGNDYYYFNMSSDATLTKWLTDVVMNDSVWARTLDVMNRVNAKKAYQVVPQSEELRNKLVDMLFDPRNHITELLERDSTYIGMKDYYGNRGVVVSSLYFWENYLNSTATIAPRERLLTNYPVPKILNKVNHVWVPTIVCVAEADYEAFAQKLDATPSQGTLYDRCFKWERLSTDTLQTYSIEGSRLKGAYIPAGRYEVCRIAMHWTHTTYDGEHSLLFDFTKDWSEHETTPLANDHWTCHNIASMEMTAADKGVSLKETLKDTGNYEDIFINGKIIK